MGQHIFETILIELGRALAAAQRYENLRYGRTCREHRAVADIPRRIFEEFYDFPGGCGTHSDRFGPQSVFHHVVPMRKGVGLGRSSARHPTGGGGKAMIGEDSHSCRTGFAKGRRTSGR
jgi:hypothetical protein